MRSVVGREALSKKVLPRGTVVRLSAPKAAVNPTVSTEGDGKVLARDDWNAGRDLDAEERRCGLLLRVRDAPDAKTEQQMLPPLEAVVKAQTADFQVNEIDARGNGAFLMKTPKGRWRKISRQKTLLVENTATPFSDPEKTFSPLVLNHGEYVRKTGKLPKDEPILQFVMYRDGYSMDSVLNRFRYELGVSSDALHFRNVPAIVRGGSENTGKRAMLTPPGGSFGCISQFGCAVGVTRELLPHASRHYNLHPLLFDPRGYYGLNQLDDLTCAPSGYAYRLLLRCVSAEEPVIENALRALSERGFINYFGMENFGVSDSGLHEAAGLAAERNFGAASGCYFESLANTSPLHYDCYMAYVNAEDSTAASIAADWASQCKTAHFTRSTQSAVSALASYQATVNAGSGHQQELERLWQSLGMHEEAQRSAGQFLWNAMASQRIITGGASRVLVGDIVRANVSSLQSPQRDTGSSVSPKRYHIVTDESDASLYDITDVVLPVLGSRADTTAAEGACLFPSSGQLTESLYREFAEAHKLSFLFDRPTQFHYRHLIAKPRNLQASVLFDPSSFASLKSDLFLLQERKPLEGSGLDFTERVREPSIYNVSERFAERMGIVRQRYHGEKSVALSFTLPAECSPLVALREAFSLKYPNFADLYFTP